MLIGHINLAKGFRGGERQTELLITELAVRGVRQRMVARVDQPLIARISDVGNLERRAVSSIVGGAASLRGVDLVHVHDGRSIQAAALAALISATPYVVTRRVDNEIKANMVTRWMYRHASVIVVLSRAIGAEVRKLDSALGVQLIPDAWCPDVPHTARVAQLRAKFGGGLVAGHVGALDHSHKGQMTIIEAAGSLPGTTFVLVGSGRDEQEFRQAAAALPNVVFTGHVDDVASHLAAFDLFLFPSLHEGLGSVLLDAMRLGLPIIATRVGGIPDIVKNGVNGILVAPEDPAALVAAIRSITQNASEMQRYADNNRLAAQRYSPSVMADRYLNLYERVLAGPDK